MSKFTPLSDELHEYIVAHGTRQDDVLRRIQEETAAMGDISVMQIAPDQGALITMLCRVLGAGEAIELGTFTGYSAICIARGLEPGGRLIACELSEEYAEIAARNFEAAGSRTGSRSASAPPRTRSATCPSASCSTSRSSTPTRRAIRITTSRSWRAPARAG